MFLLPLLGIDVQQLAKEQDKSTKLSEQLVATCNQVLEKAIDRGRNYQQIKQLNAIYQDAQAIKAVLAPTHPNQQPPQDSLKAFFKKALEPPIDLDKALSLTDALQKKIQGPPSDPELSQVLAVLNQLELSLHRALDLKSQWLETKKAN